MSVQKIEVGSAKIHLTNFVYDNDIILDEIDLEGGNILVEPTSDAANPVKVGSGETKIRIVISEKNLNSLLKAKLPQDIGLRGVQIALLSGKARVSGQYVKIIAIPFSVDAAIRIENGIKILLNFQGANAGGLNLPTRLVELLEQELNKALGQDLSRLPIPIWVDSAQIEAGRLIVTGKAKIQYPLGR